MTTFGCTGHQAVSAGTRRRLCSAIAAQLAAAHGSPLAGTCSLAAGADQIFAHLVIAAGGSLDVVVPSRGYEGVFQDPAPYRALLSLAANVDVLDHDQPGEAAYLAAGLAVVDRCDVLLAVWDGEPAAGKGGTADVVAYARSISRPVRILWPEGSARG